MKTMTRWKAASIHFTLSALAIGSVAAFVLTFWYPPRLLHFSGVDRLIALIAVVDVTVGPLLTLIVYRAGKRGLRLDLTLIAIIQIGLLTYGLHVLSQVRPIYLVGVVDRLELVVANDINDADLEAAAAPYNTRPWFGPALVAAPLPMDTDIRFSLITDAAEGRDIQHQPKYYVPFDSGKGELMLHAHPIKPLLDLMTAQERAFVNTKIDDRDTQTLRYLPVRTATQFGLVIIDNNANVGAIVSVNPYDIAARAAN